MEFHGYYYQCGRIGLVLRPKSEQENLPKSIKASESCDACHVFIERKPTKCMLIPNNIIKKSP